MSEKKNIKREPSAAEAQQAKGEKEAIIYLGPAIAGVAMPGTVYRNGLTPQLQKAVKEEAALEILLVPVTAAMHVRLRLKDPQSAPAICYQRAVEYAKRKGAEG